ncbi:hypothetical protein Tco_1393746 [Tanacetum coccineum]
MLGPRRYSQWRYLTSVVIEVVAATVDSPEVPEHDEAETIHNMSEENKLYFKAEKEAIFLLLTGSRDESTQCNAGNMLMRCDRHERLQQGESLNIQDVKTNLFWEFGKFTSRDGESHRSLYYSRDPNKLSGIRNKTEDTTPRYNNNNQSGQFRNQRTMTVAGARETVGSHGSATEWDTSALTARIWPLCKRDMQEAKRVKSLHGHWKHIKFRWQRFRRSYLEESQFYDQPFEQTYKMMGKNNVFANEDDILSN